MDNSEQQEFLMGDDSKVILALDHATKRLKLELWQRPVEMKGKKRELLDWEKSHEVQMHTPHPTKLGRLLGELTVIDEQAQP